MKYSLNIFHTTVVVLNFGKNTHARSFDPISKQECIPVGVVHAGIHPPPGVGLETPHPGCGPGDISRQTPQLPPWVWTWNS